MPVFLEQVFLFLESHNIKTFSSSASPPSLDLFTLLRSTSSLEVATTTQRSKQHSTKRSLKIKALGGYAFEFLQHCAKDTITNHTAIFSECYGLLSRYIRDYREYQETQRAARVPLRLQPSVVPQIATFEPDFQSNFALQKDWREPDREKSKIKQLKRQVRVVVTDLCWIYICEYLNIFVNI